MFSAVAFRKNHLSVIRVVFDISEIKVESVAGEIAVSVKSDSGIDGIHIVDAAVIPEREVQIQAAARERQNWDCLIVTLTAGKPRHHQRTAYHRDQTISCAAGVLFHYTRSKQAS